MSAYYGDDKPITAFATTPGKSALTLIRCSGKGAVDLASSVFSAPEKIKNASGNTLVHGWIVSANEKIDEVIISVFRAPKSYTGEDSLDISCHGGFAAGKAVMEALKLAGFREALPGEFTFRAFMNGKLDLSRAESVMELVSAKTETGRRHAVTRLSGALETEINEIKKMLVEVLSGAEIFLDYSEDEISADADEKEGKLPKQDIALETLARLKKLSISWQHERIYQEGFLAVIAGRPNAGKSSLFNLLLKEDRSIVTEIPGTTRDWIEAWVSVEGIPIRLVDTAGLRDSADPAEKAGVERSRKLLEDAELILYLIDGAEGVTAEDKAFVAEQRGKTRPLLVLWNKCDISTMPSDLLAANAISVSAKTGDGDAQLYAAIISAVQAQTAATDLQTAALGSQRQKNLVDVACTALEEALALAEREEPLDIIAPLLREAVNALGEITGEVSTADILEEMFSKFCVGK
ncbi:MAG: tRNA uridine-5-carboxymethylaminomethyl(34) synthesis GTPase MnmE [Treponema sp.]|jgi:tRNA modification GTPase|nr:tRNA uridine-5-carboxymethylaminomethyl(34) synthesis GTPase MnmE [Treponema sp.]